MARQLKGMKKEPSQAPMTKKEPAPTKPKKSGGLLSGMFGKKPKVVEDDEYDQDEQEEVVETQAKPKRTLKQRKAPVKQEPEEVNEVEAKPKRALKKPENAQPKRREIVKPTNEQIVETMKKERHQKPTPKTIEKNYSQKTLEQNVFMYMTPKFFRDTQKYYNETYSNVNVVGTNSLDMLTPEFNTKSVCNSILLFIFTQNEVKPLHHFLRSIGLEKLDKRLLLVFIVVREGIDVSDLLNDEVITDFIFASEYVKIDRQHQLTGTILDKAISGIIQNQPVYTDVEVKSFEPKKLEKTSSPISELYRVDTVKLRESVEKAKNTYYNNSEKVKVIKSLSSSKAEDITNTINQVPHIQVIEEVEKTLEDHIAQIKNTPHMKNELKTVLESQFLVKAYKAKEVEVIVNEVIDRVDSKLEEYEKRIARFNKSIFDELDACKTDVAEMKRKRQEVTDTLNKCYAEYNALIGVAANGYAIEARVTGEACNGIAGIIKNNSDLLPSDAITTMSTQVKKMKQEVEKFSSEKEDTKRRLAEVINASQQLVCTYQIALSYDKLIIDKLEEIIKIQEASAPTVRVLTDTVFKTIGVTICNVKGSGLDTILNLILSPRDLVLYLGDKEQTISDNEIELTSFLSKSWEPSAKQVITVSDKKYNIYWKDQKNIDRVFNKLNYVAKYFDNIYIVCCFDEYSEQINNPLFIKFVQEIGSIVYSIKGDLEYAAFANSLHNSLLEQIRDEDIHSIRTIINKVPKNYNKEIKPQLMSALDFTTKPISIPIRKDIASRDVDSKTLATLKSIKDAIK